jgi:hypothetical protein
MAKKRLASNSKAPAKNDCAKWIVRKLAAAAVPVFAALALIGLP